MRRALTSRFEHSNRELLALSVCRDIAFFVVHGSPGGLRGVPGESQERARGSHGRPGGPRDVPRGPRGVPRRPRGVPGVARGVPRDLWDPKGLWGRPRHPRDPLRKDDSVI